MNLNKVVFRFVSIRFFNTCHFACIDRICENWNICYDFGYRVFTEAPVDAEPGRDVVVQISDDMSDMDIAKELKEKGLVENAKLFFVQLKVSAYSGRLHSGVYTLNTSMTTRDMMVLMAAEPEQSSTDDTETVTGTTEETTEETTDTQTDADTVTGEE